MKHYANSGALRCETIDPYRIVYKSERTKTSLIGIAAKNTSSN